MRIKEIMQRAFCLQSMSILNIDSVMRLDESTRKRLEFFCHTQQVRCHVKVVPRRRKGYRSHFKRIKQMHHIECPYFDNRDHDGHGMPPSNFLPSDPDIIIPTRLGADDSMPRPLEFDMSLNSACINQEQLKQWIYEANLEYVENSIGSLQEVVVAWEHLRRQKPQYVMQSTPLIIKDHDVGYAEAVHFPRRGDNDLEMMPWGKQIICFYVDAIRDDGSNGLWLSKNNNRGTITSNIVFKMGENAPKRLQLTVERRVIENCGWLNGDPKGTYRAFLYLPAAPNIQERKVYDGHSRKMVFKINIAEAGPYKGLVLLPNS